MSTPASGAAPTPRGEYVLYGTLGSGAASVHAALELAGAPYRVVPTARWEPGDAWDELLAVNPLGQVPTLRLPDGSALSESAAILVHLAERYPAAGLLPRDEPARAQAIRGLVYIAANCYPCITVIDYPERFCADSDNDEALKQRIRAGTRERLHRHWEIFADVFPARPYLGGADVGALDLYATVVAKWAGTRAHVKAHRPALHEAFERTESHPKVAKVFAQHWPAKSA